MNKLENNPVDTSQENQRKGSSEETPGYFLGEFWKLLRRYFVELSDSEQHQERRAAMPSPKKKPEKSFLLTALRIYLLLLMGLFLCSFYWDFDGVSVTILDTIYPLDGLLRIVTVSGFIGFLTNWLAITMLFRPAQKRPLLGHGLIPAHKNRIAGRLALAVSEDLINPEIIKQRIHQSEAISRYRETATAYFRSVIDNPKFRTDLKNLVVRYVEEMIREPEVRTRIAQKMISEIDETLQERSLEKVAIRTYTFLKGREMQELVEEALIHLPASVEKGLTRLDELLDQLPAYMEKEGEQIENALTVLIHRLVNQLDVYSLVEENLKRYDEGKLERMIRSATNEQLHHIQYLGAILGTIGGLVIWQPIMSLTGLGLLFLTLVAADKCIMLTRHS